MSDLYNSVLFPTPVWDVYEPRFIKPLIKATNFYVKEAKKEIKNILRVEINILKLSYKILVCLITLQNYIMIQDLKVLLILL